MEILERLTYGAGVVRVMDTQEVAEEHEDFERFGECFGFGVGLTNTSHPETDQVEVSETGVVEEEYEDELNVVHTVRKFADIDNFRL